MNKKIFLFEEYDISPDSFEYNDIYFDWSDFDAVPFIYQISSQKFYFLPYCGSHWDLKKDIAAQELDYSDYSDFHNSQSYSEQYDKFEKVFDKVCSDLATNTVEGRAWIRKNALAFWGNNIEKHIINIIINNIQEEFNCIFDNPLIVFTNKIIHLNDYQTNFTIDSDKEKELRAIHLLNQQQKRDKLADFRRIRGEKDGRKLGNMTMAQYHNLIYQESYDPLVNENLEVEVEPTEINLSSFKPKNELNKLLWDKHNLLKSKIRLQLLDITDDFIEFVKMKWIKPIDIILTGSICNYNWSKYSDIDIHIIVDMASLNFDMNLLKEYFNMKRNEWNSEHNHLEMFNFKVEFYIEDIHDLTISNGIYSLMKNKWIKKPHLYSQDINKDKSKKLRCIAADIMTFIDDVECKIKKIEDKVILRQYYNKISNLLSLIKKSRKYGLEKNGEYSLYNILYKILRRTEYLDKIWNLKIFIYDKINSIKKL